MDLYDHYTYGTYTWADKNYYYPDLEAGYHTSQWFHEYNLLVVENNSGAGNLEAF